MIEKNKVASIEYEVVDTQTNNLVDSNKNGAPIEFLIGANQMIAGLENALLGAKVGDEVEVEVKPQDAYGLYQAELIQEVPKEQFEGIDLKEGMTLFGQSDDGQTAQVIVKGFNDNVVMIDYNHPLAGKTLGFKVKVLDVRDASELEILQGRVDRGGCGCGSGGGGCCGGGGQHHHHGGGGGCGCH
ncbi:MAG: peptidylprolyl isomerase [Helicobacter sp.]|nr:peptidylprolyl isomerase [Helicobacter sp.]MCI7485578.1 peptidylprolyl isomerase [Helicobacter sp.]MDD7567434.1 peptidylprolyl isomerase [Helicobacter sp.]MDY5740351.1 peptidylprolyl isomerase [Helicobacter sp.]